jgi:predicted TIM-barrel fold metal-dependent hydrolase
VGEVARDYPDATFIIYHSAIDAGLATQAPPEGPYDPMEANPTSVNALIRSLQDFNIQPGQNVYAEIGTTIDRLMSNPTAAAHFFGKLMLYVGVDNIVWGTDCVIGGSPQGRIEWFRTLTIPDSMQQEFGYQPLDATAKAKIFGLNAARLYGIDTDAMRCQVNSCGMADLKRYFDEEYGGRRWMFQTPGGPKTWEEYVEHSERARKLGRPG